MASELIRTRIQLDPLAFSSANKHRTPGIHLTDVLRDHDMVISGDRPKYGGNTMVREALDAYALQGYLWEDVMTEGLKGKVKATDGAAIGVPVGGYKRLPEIALRIDGAYAFYIDPEWPDELLAILTRDCILMTPDGLRTDGKKRLLECKWTTKSVGFNPEAEGKRGKREWFHQVKGYLLGVSAVEGELLDEVEWHVQFPCGNRCGEQPIYERWDRAYDREDIMQTWQMVTGHVLWRVREGGDPHGWGRYLD